MKKINLRSPKVLKYPFDFKKTSRRMTILFVAIMFFIINSPWQQTIHGQGVVIAYSPGERQQVISAPITGLINKWFVNEGSFVKAGQKIVLLQDPDPNLMQHLNAEKKAIEMQIDTLKQAAKISTMNVSRQKQLFEKGISSKRKFELAKLELAKYESSIAKTEVSLAKIKVRISRQESQLVRSPQDGTIIRRLAGNESVSIKQGDVLAELVPNTKSRAVELWVDGNDAPLINMGDEVVLQFEGWPAIQVSGWPSVAVNTFRGKILVIDPAADDRGYFRLLIMPKTQDDWPNLRFLRQGVQAQGWVQLGRVRIWYEVWRQFNGFPVKPTKPVEYK